MRDNLVRIVIERQENWRLLYHVAECLVIRDSIMMTIKNLQKLSFKTICNVVNSMSAKIIVPKDIMGDIRMLTPFFRGIRLELS